MALIDKICFLATSAVVISSGSAFVAYASSLGNGETIAMSSVEEASKPVQNGQLKNSSWDWGFQNWPTGDGKSNLEWF